MLEMLSKIKRSLPTKKKKKPPDLRIQIVSDIHIEFYKRSSGKNLDFLIEPQAPVLALLGDIGYACTDQLKDFLHSQADRFETVLFLAGNHEYYNQRGQRGKRFTIQKQLEWMRRVCAERSNLHFMEQESMELNGIVVLGTTLWSDIPPHKMEMAEQSMNDYHLCYNQDAPGEPLRKLKAAETVALYQQSLVWLKSELETAKENNQAVVVLTHHTPMITGTSHPDYENSSLTPCFSSDLKYLLLESTPHLVAWACGHTHYNFDFRVGDVRVVSNQRGYKHRPKEEYEQAGVVLELHAR